MTLAGRFTNFEMRLDDIEAKLDRIVALCTAAKPDARAEMKPAAGAKASPRQNRTRKKG